MTRARVTCVECYRVVPARKRHLNGLQNAQTDPSRMLLCPNFALFGCPALVTAGTLRAAMLS